MELPELHLGGFGAPKRQMGLWSSIWSFGAPNSPKWSPSNSIWEDLLQNAMNPIGKRYVFATYFNGFHCVFNDFIGFHMIQHSGNHSIPIGKQRFSWKDGQVSDFGEKCEILFQNENKWSPGGSRLGPEIHFEILWVQAVNFYGWRTTEVH